MLVYALHCGILLKWRTVTYFQWMVHLTLLVSYHTVNVMSVCVSYFIGSAVRYTVYLLHLLICK